MFKTIFSAVVGLGLIGSQALSQPANPLPQGAITIVVPLAAGGPADVMARLLSEYLGPRIGRTVLVENKPGAAGNIGAAAVAAAPPNGSTWLYTVDSVVTINPHIAKMASFNAVTDLVPAARAGSLALILAVNSKRVPSQSFKGLLAYGNSNTLNFGSAGIGSPGHLAFEYLRLKTGIKGEHVPYRGAAPVLNDLLAGQIEAAFIVGGALIEPIKAGSLRALAISSDKRDPLLPDVPTAIEVGVADFDATFSNYLLAPAATSPVILEFMAMHIKDFISQPETQARLKSLFMEPSFAGPADAQARIVRDREKWGRVVAATNMKPR